MGQHKHPSRVRELEARMRARIASNQASKQTFGYKNEHALIEEEIAPPSTRRLAKLLQLPQNKELHDLAIQGQTFEDCLGIIAARYNILLDGEYDVPALCDLLCRAIEANPSVKKELVPVEAIEREGSIEIVKADHLTIDPKHSNDPVELQIRLNSTFMDSVGCKICNQITLCKSEGKCLGNSLEVHMEAVKGMVKQ